MDFVAQNFAALGAWLDQLHRAEGFWPIVGTISVITLILAQAFFGRDGQASSSDSGSWGSDGDGDGGD